MLLNVASPSVNIQLQKTKQAGCNSNALSSELLPRAHTRVSTACKLRASEFLPAIGAATSFVVKEGRHVMNLASDAADRRGAASSLRRLAAAQQISNRPIPSRSNVPGAQTHRGGLVG